MDRARIGLKKGTHNVPTKNGICQHRLSTAHGEVGDIINIKLWMLRSLMDIGIHVVVDLQSLRRSKASISM